MTKPPRRARTNRRVAERALRKTVAERQRLAAAAPGGSRDHPLVVTSASVVEGQARSTPCVQCGGELQLEKHDAEAGDLRVVHLVCRLCHAPRALWFRIEPPLSS
jgi:hypothetical protein